MTRREPVAAPARRAAERHGRRSEAVAALFLRFKGYRVLARRYRTPVGEIDLVVRRGRTVAFVEVKARGDAEAALVAVSPTNRGRVARAAAFWLAQHPAAAELTLRFDVVVVARRRWPRHLTAAFDADGRA